MTMLHEFLTSNRDELIRRCRSKVSKRDSPPVTPSELEHGVPLFLEELVWALRCEEENPGLDRDRIFGPLSKTPAAVESSRTAALHGKELLDDGYSVDQVVHDYGDICQAITELATERNAPVTVEEFRTFNRLLETPSPTPFPRTAVIVTRPSAPRASRISRYGGAPWGTSSVSF